MRQRLFEMLYWLVGRGGATAKELAEHFEISERTVYRDIDALCAAGVPLYAEHGRGGGYKLRKDFVLDRALLTRGERQDVPENAASRALLEKLGFSLRGKADGLLLYQRKV